MIATVSCEDLVIASLHCEGMLIATWSSEDRLTYAVKMC